MERLTHERNNGIKTGYWSPAKKEELIQRLAAYEDAGLEPKAIKAVIDKVKKYKEIIEEPKEPCQSCAKAEEELPCGS